MRTISIVCAIACLVVSTSVAQAGLLGPTPYLSFNDSPFSGLIVDDYFYNETFEDGLLNTPGLSAASGFGGNVIGGIPAGGLIDSVDADDGLIDGSGSRGHSYFRANGGLGFVFQFSASLPGGLPTHAGLVWTDGQVGTTVTFEAFDAANLSLGTIAALGIATSGISGQTAEDRFFGISHAGGISAIKITHPGGGIEVDHVQYGRLLEPNATVPEPTSLAVWGLLGLLATRYRRRRLSVTCT